MRSTHPREKTAPQMDADFTCEEVRRSLREDA
jgi:hypothetical protein